MEREAPLTSPILTGVDSLGAARSAIGARDVSMPAGRAATSCAASSPTKRYDLVGIHEANGQEDSVPRAAEQAFRPIQYLGSKIRLLPAIGAALTSVDDGRPGAICDLFSGSAVVAHAHGVHADVIAVDVQEYARVLASGVLTGSATRPGFLKRLPSSARKSEHHQELLEALRPLVETETECMSEASDNHPARLDEFVEGASLVRFSMEGPVVPRWLKRVLTETVARIGRLSPAAQASSLITRLYGGSYFSYRQAAGLDALRAEIAKTDVEVERDLCMGALLSVASVTVNTVGKQFAQPIRLRKSDGSFPKVLVAHTLHDRSIDVFETYADWGVRWARAASEVAHFKHHAIRADYREFLSGWSGSIRAFYADPPYTIDHYSRFYHVLETICRYDEPALARMCKSGTERIMRGLYRAERHQSPFCIPSTVEQAFTDLFDRVARFHAPLVLSYSPDRNDGSQRPRLLDLPSLRRLATKSFSKVELVRVQDHTHRKLNADANNVVSPSDGEMLFICRP